MSARLVRFTFSTTTTYVIEVGVSGTVGYFRFFTNRQQILNGTYPLELTSPYADADLAALQFRQINDVVYITHPDYPVYKLVRVSNTVWTLAEVDWSEPPFLDENLTTTTIEISGSSGTAGADVDLLASSDIFQSTHVGAYWRIGHKAPGAYKQLGINADGSSDALEIYGPWNLRTYGNWGADILVQRSADGTSGWETVSNFHGDVTSEGLGRRNLDATGTAEEFAFYRITVENWDSNSESSAIAILERPEAVVYGYVQITAVGSGQSASATVIEPMYAATATDIWAEGAWSDYRGYPRCCAVHEGRLVFGGTEWEPLTLRGSVVDDFENMRQGTGDSDAYVWALASNGQAQMQWLASREALLVGTSSGNWRVRGDGFGNPITPSRVDAKKRDNEGSEYIPAEECGEPVVFVGRKGRKLFALSYQEGADNLVSEDLTILAEHITESGVLSLAWQEDKRILWATRTDGVLIGLTYDSRQEVAGWHQHTTDGDFTSVTTIYGDSDAEDEVWLIAERVIGSETVFYVELLDPDLWTAKADYFGVDSGLTYEGSPETDFTGADHLAGETIVGLADGRVFTTTVDANGAFSLPSGYDAASTVHAGLAFTSELSPFRLDADAALGVHLARTKQIDGVALRLAYSVGGLYYIGTETFPIKAPPTLEGSDANNPDLLGVTRPVDVPLVGWQQNRTRDPGVRIVQSDPLPLAILGIAVAYSVGES